MADLRMSKSKARWILRSLAHRHEYEVMRFVAYLRDYGTGPKLWPSEGADKPKDLDESLDLVTCLCREFGWPENAVWDMGIGKTQWYAVAAALAQGAKLAVWTPTDEEAYQRHLAKKRDMREKREAELVAAGMTEEEAEATALQEEQERERQFKERIRGIDERRKA